MQATCAQRRDLLLRPLTVLSLPEDNDLTIQYKSVRALYSFRLCRPASVSRVKRLERVTEGSIVVKFQNKKGAVGPSTTPS